MILSKEKTLEIIESKLREVWPYERFGKYSEPLIREILKDVKESIFNPKSRSSLIGHANFALIDLNRNFVEATIAWSRIRLPEENFKENIKVEVGDSRYIYNVHPDLIKNPQIISGGKRLHRSFSFSLWELSRKRFSHVNDVEHWLSNRKGYTKYADIFYKIHLDPSCLLNRQIYFISANRIIPAVILCYYSVYHIIYDNREDTLFSFDVRNKESGPYVKEFVKKFPRMTKKDLKLFLSALTLKKFSWFSKNYNPFKRDFLID